MGTRCAWTNRAQAPEKSNDKAVWFHALGPETGDEGGLQASFVY